MEEDIEDREKKQQFANLFNAISGRQVVNNEYLVRNDKEPPAKKYKLVFPYPLDETEKSQVTDALIRDVLNNPTNSILALTELPADYRLDMDAFDRQLKANRTTRQQLAEKSQKDMNAAKEGFLTPMITGLVGVGLAAGVGPLIGILLVGLGVTAAFPPLLIAAMAVCAAVAVVGLGIAAYQTYQEKKATEKLTTCLEDIGALSSFLGEDIQKEVSDNPLISPTDPIRDTWRANAEVGAEMREKFGGQPKDMPKSKERPKPEQFQNLLEPEVVEDTSKKQPHTPGGGPTSFTPGGTPL